MVPNIQNARPLPIDDRTLATLRRIGHDAAIGECTPAEAEWLLSCCGPLLTLPGARREGPRYYQGVQSRGVRLPAAVVFADDEVAA